MYVQICISLIKSRNPRMVVKNCPFVSSYKKIVNRDRRLFSYLYYNYYLCCCLVSMKNPFFDLNFLAFFFCTEFVSSKNYYIKKKEKKMGKTVRTERKIIHLSITHLINVD